MPNNADPISAAQAATETGIPKRTILAAITRGDLKAKKLPGLRGAYIINRRNLDAYISKKQAPAPITGTDGKTYAVRHNAVVEAKDELSAIDIETSPDKYRDKFSDLVDAEGARREIARQVGIRTGTTSTGSAPISGSSLTPQACSCHEKR